MLALTLLLVVSCVSHYTLTGAQQSRVLINKAYDANPDASAVSFLSPYTHVVDSLMNPVVGATAKELKGFRPESPLSNLLSDIMVWGGKKYNEKPDFGIYNMGGIRAALPKGTITNGDVLDAAPFENKICFVTLKGSDVMELFKQIAKRGGEGVNHSVRLVITMGGQLESATINGKNIDPTAEYRIATIDYLAQGNDGLLAFKNGTNLVSPQSVEDNTRYVIADYFKEQTKAGKMVDANIEGRIKIHALDNL